MIPTSKKQIVDDYTDGFRQGDPSKVLECLAEDVVWRLHGCQEIRGKAAFEAEISNEEFANSPHIEISTYVEEADKIVIIGHGMIRSDSDGDRSFSFCEVFKLHAERISEIDTFHIWETR